MEKIEVSIISRHTIKPSASSSLLQPYKLSLLDQLTPAMYMPMVYFYPISDPAVFNLPQILADLRKALSETLTLYYPLSGRVKNNLYIDDFEAGVPYLEARVKCRMTDFLRLQKIEWLNEFFPIKTYSMEPITELYPLLGVQVNIFDSGIAIGVCISHKLIDGVTSDCFLQSWGAVYRGRREKIIHPNLSQAALLFPPRDDLPEKYVDHIEKLWFAGKKVSTRRFVFGAKAISAIQDEAKSESVPKPSRVQAVTGFLWKHQLAASRALTSGTTLPRLYIAAQAVNLRPHMNMETTLYNSTGNLMWWASATLELSHTTPKINDLKLCDLVNLLNGSIKQCNSDYFEMFKGNEGYGNMCEYLDFQRLTMSSIEPTPEIYSFSSWTTFYDQLDFGWGKSSWIGLTGEIESAFCNSTILVPTQYKNGIEAWVNLEDEKMSILENDPQFLALTSQKPLISRY